MTTKVCGFLAVLILLAETAPAGFRIGKWKVRYGHGLDKPTDKAGHTVDNVKKATEKAAGDIAKAVHKGVEDFGAEFDRGKRRTGATLTKAGKDTVNEVIRAPKNLDRARLAIQGFVYHELQDEITDLKAADRRILEGKFADAFWHLATDPLKDANQNAVQMAKQSGIVRAIGQIAATAYGGPGGAAAYASWYTYSTTKNPELALRVGMITGATSYAMSQVAKMPSQTVDPDTGTAFMSAGLVTKKALIAGAVGGLAVAASGGDDKALRQAFLASGGCMVLQDIYQNATDHTLDARVSTREGYAMLADPLAKDAPPLTAYYDENGDPWVDENGHPFPNVLRTDPRVSKVGIWADPAHPSIIDERSPVMYALSKIPGFNAMALLHDQFCVYYHTGMLTTVATIPPAIVFTYMGTGSPLYDEIQKTGVKSSKGQSVRPSSGYEWTHSDRANDLTVSWIPGTVDRLNPNVIASNSEGIWQPEIGYQWLDPTKQTDLRVHWAPGSKDIANHLVAGQLECTWEPDAGYTWSKATPGDITVRPSNDAPATMPK